jgi:hypothetical protein
VLSIVGRRRPEAAGPERSLQKEHAPGEPGMTLGSWLLVEVNVHSECKQRVAGDLDNQPRIGKRGVRRNHHGHLGRFLVCVTWSSCIALLMRWALLVQSTSDGSAESCQHSRGGANVLLIVSWPAWRPQLGLFPPRLPALLGVSCGPSPVIPIFQSACPPVKQSNLTFQVSNSALKVWAS